ncbi:hypothetical protein DY000_02049398 [Brassica cretica]|uniref:Uncharacterized protein n=1 Tax=Brassica cretica TaxID=69181 RepID=A0ABQ7F1G4_BRACR|nr:hypothetical protein DY000_02049398 [Brassica cretica]
MQSCLVQVEVDSIETKTRGLSGKLTTGQDREQFTCNEENEGLDLLVSIRDFLLGFRRISSTPSHLVLSLSSPVARRSSVEGGGSES